MSNWDPSKHPRKPAGSSDGGQWADSDEAAFASKMRESMSGSSMTNKQLDARVLAMVQERRAVLADRKEYHDKLAKSGFVRPRMGGDPSTASIPPQMKQRLAALSSGGKNNEAMHTTKLNPDVPSFVTDFARRFPSIGERQSYLQKAPLEKLETAKRLLGSRIDASSNLMRSLVDAELSARASIPAAKVAGLDQLRPLRKKGP